MEFHIDTTGMHPNLDTIDDAIRTLDPSAVVDLAPAGSMLRVAAAASAAELIALLGRIGYPVQAGQVRQLPSICCGGCSG